MLFKNLPIFDYDADVTVTHGEADYLELPMSDIEKFMNLEVETFNVDDFDDDVFIEVQVSDANFKIIKDTVPECYFG